MNELTFLFLGPCVALGELYRSANYGHYTFSKVIDTGICSTDKEAHIASSKSCQRVDFPLQFERSMPRYFEPLVSTIKAAFGLQCFWHSEAHLASVKGVIRTRVGYAGGTTVLPTYRNIGDHVETVEIDFDPTTVTYEELLDRFWAAHDPTVKHKRQYISAIFYYNEEQKESALQSMQSEKKRRSGILTEILPIGQLYNAENYHQKYILRYEKPLFNALGLNDAEVISSHVAAKLNGYIAGYGSVEQFNLESENWDLDDSVRKLALAVIASKGGKATGCDS